MIGIVYFLVCVCLLLLFFISENQQQYFFKLLTLVILVNMGYMFAINLEFVLCFVNTVLCKSLGLESDQVVHFQLRYRSHTGHIL